MLIYIESERVRWTHVCFGKEIWVDMYCVWWNIDVFELLHSMLRENIRRTRVHNENNMYVVCFCYTTKNMSIGNEYKEKSNTHIVSTHVCDFLRQQHPLFSDKMPDMSGYTVLTWKKKK